MKIKLTFIPNEKEDGLSSFISGFLLFVTPCITYEIVSKLSGRNDIYYPKDDYSDDIPIKLDIEGIGTEYIYLYARNRNWRIGGSNNIIIKYREEITKELLSMYYKQKNENG
jgi:hypothetical protein